MDTQLLRIYDKAQDIDALYREILRNVSDKSWYAYLPFFSCKYIDLLRIEEQSNYFRARSCDGFWTVEKWINLT